MNPLIIVFMAAVSSNLLYTEEFTFTQEETHVADVFRPLYEELRGLGIDIQVGVMDINKPGTTPIGMFTPPDKNKITCVLAIKIRGNPAYEGLLELVPVEERDSFLLAVEAHETAHCLQAFTKTYNEEVAEKEADAFGILWTSKYNPTHLEAAKAGLIRLRTEYPQPGHKYETIMYIDAAVGVDVSNMSILDLFKKAQEIVSQVK